MEDPLIKPLEWLARHPTAFVLGMLSAAGAGFGVAALLAHLYL